MSYLINCIPEAHLGSWYKWLTILAIALPIFGAVVGGAFGYGAFLVGDRVSGLQAVALTRAENIANAASDLAAQRHLPQESVQKMLVVAKSVCSQLKRIPVTASNGNAEAQAYAMDFVDLFKEAGCESDLELPIPGLTPDVQGIIVGVRDTSNLPASVYILDKILVAGGLKYTIIPMKDEFFPGEQVVFVVGAKQH